MPPTLSALDPMPEHNTYVEVSVARDGGFRIEGAAIGERQLRRVLARGADRLREDNDGVSPPLVVRCDRGVAWRHVSRLLGEAGWHDVVLHQVMFVAERPDGTGGVFGWRLPGNIEAEGIETTPFSVWIRGTSDKIRDQLKSGPTGWRNGVVGLAVEPDASAATVLSLAEACRQAGARFLYAVVTEPKTTDGSVEFAKDVGDLPKHRASTGPEGGYTAEFYFSEAEWEAVEAHGRRPKADTTDDDVEDAPFK